MDRTRRAVRIAVTPSSVLNYLISDQEQRQFVCQDLWVIAFPRVLTTWDFWPWKSTRQELFLHTSVGMAKCSVLLQVCHSLCALFADCSTQSAKATPQETTAAHAVR